MNLQERILAVLEKPECRCVWPARRQEARLFLDDMSIPDGGLRLWWALRRLEKKGLIVQRNGYVGLKGGAA